MGTVLSKNLRDPDEQIEFPPQLCRAADVDTGAQSAA